MSGIVAIIGRPNVGKSTFFNRLIGERKAIVDDSSGVTRDRHYGIAHWSGVDFTIIDTGGYVTESDDIFEKAIREQVHIAMEEADVLVFMVDVTTGITPLDQEFADIVRRSNKPVILVVNKVDHHGRAEDSFEFYELALGTPFDVSSVNGSGTGDVLDEILRNLPDKPAPLDDKLPRIAVVGRPNVGKSSLINALLGHEANIVTPIAGTTRDSLHTRYQAFGHDIYLVDTAGLRKKSKIEENIEFYSTLRTLRGIEECDVAILMLDATQGIESQDLNVLSQIEKQRKGVVIVVNKWDLVMDKDTHTAKEYQTAIEERIKPLSGVPIIFISVQEKQRVLKVLDLAMHVYAQKNRKISTSVLNEKMLAAIQAYKPPSIRGKFVRIKYITQVEASVPTFLFFTNHPKDIKENYKRYLENKIREYFGFEGVPINLFFRQK